MRLSNCCFELHYGIVFWTFFIPNLEGLGTSPFNYGIKIRDPQSQKEKTEFGKILKFYVNRANIVQGTAF